MEYKGIAMASGWYTPRQKDWKYMTTGEKVAMLVIYPPVLTGFVYAMGSMFYWVGRLIWEVIQGVF